MKLCGGGEGFGDSMRVGYDDHYGRVVAGGADGVEVGREKEVALVNDGTGLNIDVKVLTVEHYGVDADVNQHFGAASGGQADGVLRFEYGRDFGVAGSGDGIFLGNDCEALTHGTAGEDVVLDVGKTYDLTCNGCDEGFPGSGGRL